jgi:hypothetical protein
MRRIISGGVALLLLLSLSALTGTADARTEPGRAVWYNGWGDLRLGMTNQQAWRTGMVSHEYGHCAAGYEMKKRLRERGYIVWKQQRRSDYRHFRIHTIVVVGAADRTVAGAGVGSTLRELRRLYPGLSPVTGGSKIDHRRRYGKDDFWVVSAHKRWGTLNFQFSYGRRPAPGAEVERIVVSRKQAYYPGC